MLRRRLLPSYPVYIFLQATSTGLFFLLSTVSAVYGVEKAHLNALQLVLVGTTLEATALVFQVPTGAVADAVSRRLSVLIGLVLTGLGFILWGAIARFETILLAQVVWGLGYTFFDGAEQAWIADEVDDALAGHAFIRGAQAGQLGAVVGIVCSAALATVSLPLPLLLAGVGHLVLAGVMLVIMGERPRPTREVDIAAAEGRLMQTVRGGLRAARGNNVLLTILGIAAIFGAASEGIDRLRDIHVLQDMTLPHLWGLNSVVWFGVIQAGGLALSVLAAEIAKRRIDTTSHRQVARVLAAINVGIVLTVVLFGLATNFALALPLMWAVFVLRRTNTPLMTAWLNQSLDPSIRATIFSMQSLSDSLGQVIGGPIIGVLAAAAAIRLGIVIAGLLFAPALLLYARTLRRGAATTGPLSRDPAPPG